MSKSTLEPLNLGSIARGALLELFEANIAKVAENIADPATDPETARTITLKLRFKPDAERRAIQVTATAQSGLAAISPHKSRAYIGKDEAGHVYLFDRDPRQDVLFEPPATDQNLINFKQSS